MAKRVRKPPRLPVVRRPPAHGRPSADPDRPLDELAAAEARALADAADDPPTWVASAVADGVAPERSRPARFWEDHEVAWTKVVVVRLVFFGLLAIDAFRGLAHVARYGAGGFNVPQVAWLPLPAPSRGVMIAIHVGLTLAFALIAQGVAVRVLLPAATALYAYGYFASQLDSYQHHYLVCLLLLLWCFVPVAYVVPPWGPGRRGTRTVRSWALRLILVQLAVLYLWAAIAKLDPLWFDGTALRGQVAPGWTRNLIGDLGWDRVAVMVLVVELTVAATIWRPRRWWLALPLGVGLHLGIELVGLEIGLFSYLTIALYLLVVPDAAFHALDRGTRRAVATLRGGPVVWLLGGWVAALAALALLSTIELPYLLPTVMVAVVVAATMARAFVRRDLVGAGASVAAFAIALGLLVVLARRTDTILDHHRYWAGASRRLGDQASARAAYRGMLAIDPTSEYAHYHLGGLDAAAGKVDDAIAHYRIAQRAAPRRARSFVAEARLVQAKGDLAGAQQLVRDALAADPEDADARALEKSMQEMAPAEGPVPAGGDAGAR